MSALALYLAAGLATFWTCALIDRLKSRKLDRRARPSVVFWRTRWVEPNRAWLRRLAVETLTRMFFCMTIWPLFFVALMFQSVHERFSFDRHADHVFAVRTHHLGERLSIAEIESREMVFDPLNAVPPLPFGFLHAAWLAFATNVGPKAVIHAFRAQQPSYGKTVLRAGYVIVTGKRRGAFFLTICKTMDDGADW